MKKIQIMMMLLASCAFVFTSCKKTPTPEPKPETITLNVAGGASVVVEGADVAKDITVIASSAPESDILVKLASDAAEGEVAFENETITIKSGTTSATGKIIFKADKFPQGTTEKAIKVTISAESSDIKLGTDNTVFKVKGVDDVDMVKLTGSTEKTEFDTTDEAQTAVINITLEKALEADLTIIGEVLAESTLPAESIEKIEPDAPMVIKAGETTMAISLTVAKESKGILALGNFSTDNKGVSIEIPKMTFTFSYEEDPGPQPSVASIATTDALEFTVGQTAIEKTFTVTLSKPAEEALNINLELSAPNTAGAALNPEIVEFAIGEISKTVTLNITKAVFVADQNTAEITIVLISVDKNVTIDANASELTFIATKESVTP